MKDVTRCITICLGVVLTAALLLAGGGTETARQESPASVLAAIRADLGLRADAEVRVATVSGAPHQRRERKRAPGNAPETPDALDLTLTLSSDNGATGQWPVQEGHYTLRLRKHSNRAEGMFVRVYGADGMFEDRDPGPVRTYRGEVVDVATGEARGEVAGSIDTDGALRARLKVEGDELWIEPVDGRLVAYRASDIALDRPLVCRVAEEASRETEQTTGGSPVPPSSQSPNRIGPTTETFDLYCANIGCDVDVEYFQHFSSVEEAQQRIEDIINIANIQYEHQVQITHRIALIVIRTAEPDPYSGFPGIDTPFFVWMNEFPEVDWDVVHLFTGKDLGGISGAANIAGICQASFRASGYVKFAVLAVAANLTKHELGHNWGASHCSCPRGTMEPDAVTSPDRRQFSRESIQSILAYRDTRPCLEQCESMTVIRDKLPFEDDFESGSIRPDTWQIAVNVSVREGEAMLSEDAQLRSISVDAREQFAVDVSYTWRSGNLVNGTLTVEYLGRSYEWFELSTHPLDNLSPQSITERLYGTGPVFGPDIDTLDFQLRFTVEGKGAIAGLDDVLVVGLPFNPCPEDCNINGTVNIDDLIRVLFQAGNPSDAMSCDVAPIFPDGSFGNEVVNIDDVIAVLSAFGPCPE